MIILVPHEIEIPDSMYIDGEQLMAEVHTTPYGGLTDVVHYESEDTRTYINVEIDGLKVYVRYNGQSHTEQFEYIEDLVNYLMRSCDIGKSTKKSKSQPTFSDMVQKQRSKNKGIKKDISEIESIVKDIEEMKRKAMEIEEKMYATDWNQYDMRSFPSKIYDVRIALDKISEGLYIQFLM